MLHSEKQKNKKLSSTLDALDQIKKTPTLSERLKKAGIKEKSDSEEKRNNAKKRSKKKKDYYKKIYIEKVIGGNTESDTKTGRKLRNLTKNYLLSYIKEPCPNKFPPKKSPSENSACFLKKTEEIVPVSTKETIFVSLDFIQDCQKYKRNVEKSKLTNLKKHQKRTKKNRSQKILNKDKKPKKVRRSGNASKSQRLLQVGLDKENVHSKESEKSLAELNIRAPTKLDSNNENAPEEDVQKQSQNNYLFESGFIHKPLKKMPSDNVAKIDKKFLESLLSIATGLERGDKTKEESENKKAAKEKQSHKKAKISENVKIEGKVENAPLQGNEKDRISESEEANDDSKPLVSYNELISTKINRDAAKSEIQIQPLKGKCDESSKMKSEKNMSVSKPDSDETRKKRKNRNKVVKNGNEETVEASPPSEVSKMADVKELWRREDREKSAHSLSSLSSCTVADLDAIPEWKNLGLQSYKTLKKLVEDEVTKISQKSVNKDEKKEVEVVKNENIYKAENSKEVEKPKNNFDILKTALAENLESTKKVDDAKVTEIQQAQKAPTQVKRKQHYSVYEGKKQNPQQSTLGNTPKEPKEKPQHPEELEKNKEKLPSEIVKNWSILNRLEQAFLALGTPTFNNTDRRPKTVEKSFNISKQNIQTNDKLRGNVYKRMKKSPSRETLSRKKAKEPSNIVGGSIPKTYQDSSSQTQPQKTKKTKIDNNLNENKTTGEVKEKPRGNKSGREVQSENSPTRVNILTPPAEEENKLKLKGKKTPRSTSDGHVQKKGVNNSPDKMKAHVHDLRYPKREAKENGISPERTKPKFGKMPSKATKINQNHEKKSEGHLESKKALGTSHNKERPPIQSRKSKSCNKINENSDLDGGILCFSQTKTQENPKNKKEVSRTVQTAAAKRKKAVKSPSVKEKPPKSNEKHKIGEKDFSLGKRASSAKSRSFQEKKYEKAHTAYELPPRGLARKEQNSTSMKRAIKERSILSMRASQHEQRKAVPKVQEKSVLAFPTAVAASTETHEQDLQIDPGTVHHLLICNKSDSTCLSTRTFDLEERNEQLNYQEDANIRLVIKEFQEEETLEDSEGTLEDPDEPLSVSSLSSHVFGNRQSAVLAAKQSPTNSLKAQQLWEQDINQYHAIVREIMSHYKRIDGFLKQSENYNNFSSSLVNLLTGYTDSGGELNALSSNLDSLQEYRKKVMYEYQALPFSEYKSKIQKKKDDFTKAEEGRKRNLQVVKDVEKGVDLDVKDFPLNIQKVLDSQLYVDADLMTRRNEALVKFKEKTSSLQDLQLFKSKISKAKVHEIEH